MTNFEKIQQLEVSGVKPFAFSSAFDVAEVLSVVPCKKCWHKCRNIETNCRDKMLSWLNEEGDVNDTV